MAFAQYPEPPKANPVRLRVGKRYRFTPVLSCSGKLNGKPRESDLRGFKVFTGKVVGEYADFYLVKTKSGYNTTIHKNSLGIDWMATKLNGGK